MICPYNHKTEKTVQQFTQDFDHDTNDSNITGGTTVTRTSFEFMHCPKEKCGAWQDGRCCYNGIR